MSMLSIDIETYSEISLSEAGMYAYAEHPSFEILLFGYAHNDEDVELIDLAAGEVIPDYILKELTDNTITKSAFNAPFERVCLANYLAKLALGAAVDVYSVYAPPEQWVDTAIKCRELGLPNSLGEAAKTLRIINQKDKKGKALIRYFCIPCKPTKANGGRTRNLPEHSIEKWEDFRGYCIKDVEVERNIAKVLRPFVFHKNEQLLWEVDQRINDRGVRIDLELVTNIVKEDARYKELIRNKVTAETGINNPNSVAQIKDYIGNILGKEIKSLNKDNIPDILREAKAMGATSVINVLKARSELAKTSNAKYNKMLVALGTGNRVRGTHQFYGAGTGRWAGRLIQCQNLPRNGISNLNDTRELAKVANYETMNMILGSFPKITSQLIRTAIIPGEGKIFAVSDFTAIEAVITAWLAGERWRQELFKKGGKIYEASAAAMFHVPVEKIVKGNPEYALRAKGKVAELALGYQGGAGALKVMGALDMGLEESELKPLVDLWRKTNPAIVQLWYDVENGVKDTIEKARISPLRSHTQTLHHGITFTYDKGFLFIRLPSGRKLAYPKARLEPNKFGGKGVVYWSARYGDTEIYGGKFVENIVQAIARDALGETLINADRAGYYTVFHVHDELIAEVDLVEDLLGLYEIMARPISWAPGLVLKADGFVSEYYKKE